MVCLRFLLIQSLILLNQLSLFSLQYCPFYHKTCWWYSLSLKHATLLSSVNWHSASFGIHVSVVTTVMIAAWLTKGLFQLSVAMSQIIAKLPLCAPCSISQAWRVGLRAGGSVSKGAFIWPTSCQLGPQPGQRTRGLSTWHVLPQSSGSWVPRMSIPKEKAK